MEITKVIERIKKQAEDFGMHLHTNESGRIKQNAVWRNNTVEISYSNNPYFGIIREGEANSQGYSDLSLVFFPNIEDKNIYLMSIGVGSEGFKEDYELASKPGFRRGFIRLLPDNHITFSKKQFTNIITGVAFDTTGFSIDRYLKVLQIGVVVDVTVDADWDIIYSWLAKYAQIRGWATNKNLRKKTEEAIDKVRNIKIANQIDEVAEIRALIQSRKYIVIEGAPGVGKTYSASELAKDYNRVFFTQFHAGTTYSDFVYGILPKLESETVIYTPHIGILLEAMNYARDHANEKVLLIIDEINRANLASVLGEVFYLFEPKRSEVPSYFIRIGNEEYKSMPDNLYVLGTMNTADRSLAVVDYALRRRFAWYKLEPHPFNNSLSDYGLKLFDRMARIFEDYATDMELNLQPGAAYFMGSSETEINSRLRFELMPLIKEYLLNGFMTQAEQPLDDYFFEFINQRIFN